MLVAIILILVVAGFAALLIKVSKK